MVEIAILLVQGGLAIAGGLLGGFLARLLYDFRAYGGLEVRIYDLEKEIYSQAQANRGSKGGAAKADKQARVQEAVQKGTEMFAQGKTLPEIAGLLGPEYADIIPELIAKFKGVGVQEALKALTQKPGQGQGTADPFSYTAGK